MGAARCGEPDRRKAHEEERTCDRHHQPQEDHTPSGLPRRNPGELRVSCGGAGACGILGAVDETTIDGGGSHDRPQAWLEETVPILRVEDAGAAVRWYERLGFEEEWTHRFEPGFPAFTCVRRG